MSLMLVDNGSTALQYERSALQQPAIETRAVAGIQVPRWIDVLMLDMTVDYERRAMKLGPLLKAAEEPSARAAATDDVEFWNTLDYSPSYNFSNQRALTLAEALEPVAEADIVDIDIEFED